MADAVKSIKKEEIESSRFFNEYCTIVNKYTSHSLKVKGPIFLLALYLLTH